MATSQLPPPRRYLNLNNSPAIAVFCFHCHVLLVHFFTETSEFIRSHHESKGSSCSFYEVSLGSGRRCYLLIPSSSLVSLSLLYLRTSICTSDPFWVLGTNFLPFSLSHLAIFQCLIPNLRDVLSVLLTTLPCSQKSWSITFKVSDTCIMEAL